MNRIVIELLAQIILPIIAIFVLKRFIIWFITHYFLVNTNLKSRQSLTLHNPKLYLIMNHFNFFFDCFIITFECFTRVVFAVIIAVFLMPRLDCSIYGRQMESYDIGFVSYVTFIHMEVNQTHPVKLAFVNLLSSESSTHRITKAKKRWFLIYTLLKNPSLIKTRKHCVKNKTSSIETLFEYIQRKFSKLTKRKGESFIEELNF
jgi:hypothetical protein